MSDPTNKVPFFLAGDGAYLRFRTKDFIGLREKYGEPKVVKAERQRANGESYIAEIWQTFTDRLLTALDLLDPIAIVDCLKAGLKTEDGVTAFSGISFDDLPFGFAKAVEPIKSAILLAITGEDYATFLRRERQEGDEDREDPIETLPTSNSSDASSGLDTLQGS